MRYFDASALVKRYVREAGSAAVRGLLAADVAVTSRLTEVEIASALARRAREGDMTPAERDRALAALGADIPSLYVVELLPAVVGRAVDLVRRRTLRAGDAVQLASCLETQARVGQALAFIVGDRRLAEAARDEGLEVVALAGSAPR
jgi:uncharacterized protein